MVKTVKTKPSDRRIHATWWLFKIGIYSYEGSDISTQG